MQIVSQNGFIAVTFPSLLDPHGLRDEASYVLTSSAGVPIMVQRVELTGCSYSVSGSVVGFSGQTVTPSPPLVEPVSFPQPEAKLVSVSGVKLYLSGVTNGAVYRLEARGFTSAGEPYRGSASFTGVAEAPKLLSAVQLDEGQVVATFSQSMRVDDALLRPGQYRITGPTNVLIKNVQTLDDRRVALTTVGIGTGEYTLSLASLSTFITDVSGTTAAKAFTVSFTGKPSLASRSVFTHKGPIAKPALTLQSAEAGLGPVVPGQEGAGALISVRDSGTATVKGLIGLTASAEGNKLTLTGAASAGHNGEFLVKTWLGESGHEVRDEQGEIDQSESRPFESHVVIYNSAGVLEDANNGEISWSEWPSEKSGQTAAITAYEPATATVKGLSGMTASSVGRLLRLSNSDSTASTETFLIKSYLSASSVVVSRLNGSGPVVNNASLGWVEHTAGAIISGAAQLTLPTANILPSHVGLYIALTGSRNDGVYLITARVSSTVVKVAASFEQPEPENGKIGWSLIDYRDGQIANDPSDVVVRVNDVLVEAEAVYGLLGQVVLPTPPGPDDDVKVDYAWVSNPVVDFRRLNSSEFCLNGWNLRASGSRAHKYRYNSGLVKPDVFDPVDIRAQLAQPLERDLKYRAYERAYSVALNDPNLLLLNSPNNRIAFPPLARLLSSTFVNYEGTILPENAPSAWSRLGSGSASISGADLVVTDDPGNDPIFWTRYVDLTFDHVFAHAWRMKIDATPVLQGVFTGLASGYSDGERACVVGFLDVEGVKKFGILRAGFGNDPTSQAAWIGAKTDKGVDIPAELDWSILRSYRILRDNAGTISVFVDGSVVASLQTKLEELPYLQELNAPFETLQGPFFGSLSREAESTSTWGFVRYTAIPINPLESEPSVFVSYEADVTPDAAAQPWTPIGFHGSETLQNSRLILDSTSATDLPSTAAGLISGDFKGYTRIEPLLRESYDTVLDVRLGVRTYTQGITPNAIMAAIDDGERLIQLSLFSDRPAPKLSYGGRELPPAFLPYKWQPKGSQTASMVGQYLKISDSSSTDELTYSVEDSFLKDDPSRVLAYDQDYFIEFRVRVLDCEPDVNGFCGVSVSAYDGLKSVGIQFIQESYVEESGQLAYTGYVELHSEGFGRPDGRFPFAWQDGKFHTIRLTKSSDLVSLFADGQLLGYLTYSTGFAEPPQASLVGKISFGSATTLSVQSHSEVLWAYVNCWRPTEGRKFIGLWKGYDPGSLTGYHLPVSATGRNATVKGAVLTDLTADFVARGVAVNDQLIVDAGPNKGVYTVNMVAPQGAVTKLVLKTVFPSQPSEVDYRCVTQMNWSGEHQYRIVKNPTSGVSVFVDGVDDPLINADYSSTALPPSSAGIPYAISSGMPSITWGAFDPANLSQTAWDFVRFGAIRSLSASGLTPHHQIINQRNIMASFEHHRSNIPHAHTNFWSESEGIPPQTEPDLLRNPNLIAYTRLNDQTPLVPATQSYEVRAPKTLNETDLITVADLDTPQEILNHRGFLVNLSARRVNVEVPDDVLYSSLQVIETSTGDADLLAPFDDEAEMLTLGAWEYRDEYHIPQTPAFGLRSLTTHSGLVSPSTPVPPVTTRLNTAGDVLWAGFPSVEARFDLLLGGPVVPGETPTFTENVQTKPDGQPRYVEGPATVTMTGTWPPNRVALLNNARWKVFDNQGPPYFITADNLTPFPAPTSTVTTL